MLGRLELGLCQSIIATLAACASFAVASSDVRGTVTEYRSPGGVTERCVALTRIDGGNYSVADAQEELLLCGIDIYGGGWALCPKVFSTSPGMLIYEVARGRFAERVAEFERTECDQGGLVK